MYLWDAVAPFPSEVRLVGKLGPAIDRCDDLPFNGPGTTALHYRCSGTDFKVFPSEIVTIPGLLSVAFLAPTRWRFQPIGLSRSEGPATGSGRNISRRSRRPRAWQTCRNHGRWVATSPDCMRSMVCLETPA